MYMKKLLGCENVISFGDAANDIDMDQLSENRRMKCIQTILSYV